MKIKDSFITYETDGEQIMVSSGNVKFSGLVRSNNTAAFIVDCLKNDTTKEEVVERILNKYEVSKEIAAADVDMVITKLRGIGALDE